jgi:hypothetical protein
MPEQNDHMHDMLLVMSAVTEQEDTVPTAVAYRLLNRLAVTEVRRCRSCKHWILVEASDPGGECSRARSEISPNGFRSISRQPDGILTGPGFGCVLFEPEDSE